MTTTTTTGGDLFDAGYVGMSLTDSVVAFDLMTESVLADVSVLPGGDYPYDVTIRPDGSEVWIVGAVGDGVVVIDTATNTVSQTIDLTGVGEYAVDVAFNTAGNVAYVSSRDSEALVVIDADAYTVSETIALPGTMDGGKMTVDPCSDLVYMVNWYDKDILRIDVGAKTIDTASIGKSLWDLRITADGETLYVTDRGDDQVLIVDAATLTVSDTVAVGDDPWGIELAESGGQVVVACEDDSTIHIIDAVNLSTIVKTLPMGASPRDVDVLGSHAYIPSGDVLGNDGIYKLLLDGDEAAFIDLGMNYNANAIAVKPQPVECVP
jgi:YVTN family beta-propeller protein